MHRKSGYNLRNGKDKIFGGVRMREIKFRAWDKKNKKMFYGDKQDEPNMIGFDGKIYTTGLTGPMCDYGCSTDYINSCDPEDYELMQYIGLKDKNGKEIYEGDIVSYFGGGYGIVYYDEQFAAFRVEVLKTGKYTDMAFIAKYGEVIANIHENPELLKKED